MKWFPRALAALAILVLAALAVLAFPQPLFAHHVQVGRFEVWSDAPIDPAITTVMADVERRLSASELMSADQRFKVFICNAPWRLKIYSQRWNDRLGGVADTWLTQNVYIRPSDIAHNRVIRPGAWSYSLTDRPLSYYIAHELTHILEARAFGLAAVVRHQPWVWEGYADLIGKGGQFDVAENLRALAAREIVMDPKASGLYRRYHLEVLYELQRRRAPLRELVLHPPPEPSVLNELAADMDWTASPRPSPSGSAPSGRPRP